MEIPTYEDSGYNPYIERINPLLETAPSALSAIDFSALMEGISSGLINFDFATGKFIIGGESREKMLTLGTKGLWIGGPSHDTAPFRVDMTGNLVATSATITGTITTGSEIIIGSGNAIFKATALGIQLGHATFASAPFNVNMAGEVVATSVTITGEVHSIVGSSYVGDVIDKAYIGDLNAEKITTGILVVARTQAKCTDPLADQTSANPQNVAWLTDAGNMAYEDLVELSKLGTTIVAGGYLQTILINAQYIQTGTLTLKSAGPNLIVESGSLVLDPGTDIVLRSVAANQAGLAFTDQDTPTRYVAQFLQHSTGIAFIAPFGTLINAGGFVIGAVGSAFDSIGFFVDNAVKIYDETGGGGEIAEFYADSATLLRKDVVIGPAGTPIVAFYAGSNTLFYKTVTMNNLGIWVNAAETEGIGYGATGLTLYTPVSNYVTMRFGSASAEIKFLHDGSNSQISTVTGDLIIAPAGSDVQVNDNLRTLGSLKCGGGLLTVEGAASGSEGGQVTLEGSASYVDVAADNYGGYFRVIRSGDADLLVSGGSVGGIALGAGDVGARGNLKAGGAVVAAGDLYAYGNTVIFSESANDYIHFDDATNIFLVVADGASTNSILSAGQIRSVTAGATGKSVLYANIGGQGMLRLVRAADGSAWWEA